MPIRRRETVPELKLDAVDELIAARKMQHGGRRGAPPVVQSGERTGAAINKSCILMLSALLQGYIESVFVEASLRTFKNLRKPDDVTAYRKSFAIWGNPSGDNIAKLFSRIGIINVFEGLTLPRCRMNESDIKKILQQINTTRNNIAHGKALPARISLSEVERLRAFAAEFGERFAMHVTGKL